MTDLLDIKDLRVTFHGGMGRSRHARATVTAVDGVTFQVPRAAVVGLVGESGSGKSTIGRAVLRLLHAAEGSVVFDGVDLLSASPRVLRALRPRMQIVFQDPISSLNPRMRVADILSEAVLAGGRVPRGDVDARVRELLGYVGLDGAAVHRYPHEFSGGQGQRIAIARAIATEPDFIVCDELVSSLDVSVQAQVLNLLCDLQDEFSLSYLFISHDLSVVQHMADSIMVLYRGKIVEVTTSAAVFDAPLHPYTRALVEAVPLLTDGTDRSIETASGANNFPPPTADALEAGCQYRGRCGLYEMLGHPRKCESTEPELSQLSDGRLVSCHYAAEDSGRGTLSVAGTN